MEHDLIDSRLLIFVNDKRNADLLHEKIEELYPEQFGVIHSNKSQNYRLNTLKDFQEENIKGIITTDIMARGLDISNVSHVINFDVPIIIEDYVHRIGRTGRAGAEGTSISFVDGLDLVNLRNTEKLIGKKIPVVKDHPFHPEKLVEQKRDSNNKPFVPKPKPQKKEDINFKKPKKKVFYRKK